MTEFKVGVCVKLKGFATLQWPGSMLPVVVRSVMPVDSRAVYENQTVLVFWVDNNACPHECELPVAALEIVEAAAEGSGATRGGIAEIAF
jgi:hypothetical protein